ncbi:hypothetical protein VZ95_10510 [Elstera litoralis]|uniref:non-specific protein-tyrosine kinase n=2 Tax=Elstera litoralis TaxID=552518 RepID=A0A0F3IVH6_9PROT|nr:hypothetical protein VZ95_10510 [Elstera litoralis]
MPLPPEQDGAGLLDLTRLLSIIRRRLPIMLAVFLTITATMLIWVTLQPKGYTAEASLALDTRRVNIQEIPNFVNAVTLDFPVVRTEVQVLQSWPLAAKVIQSLNMSEHPEYGNRPGRLARIAEALPLPDSLRALFASEPKPPLDMDQMVNRFSNGLSVLTDGRSYVIRVQFRSSDPALAAAAANQLVTLYLSGQEDERVQTVKRINGWLNERAEELRTQVRRSELAVQQFRQQNNLSEMKGTSVSQQQISELSNQMILSAAERAEKEARLRQLQQSRSSGNIASIVEVMNSPLITRLREQEAQIIRREAELTDRYGEKHPTMIAVRAERDDLRRKIDAEIAKIAQAMSAEADIARVREASLRNNLDVLRRQAAQANPAEVRLRELERDVDANRAVLDAFLTRIQEGATQENFVNPVARFVSPAQIPKSPDQPRMGLTMVITIVIGGAIAFVLAVMADHFDRTVRSSEQLERDTGISCLGLVPRAGRLGSRPDTVLNQRDGLFSEAIRSIRAALKVSSLGVPPKVILLTSAVAGEGKSLIALSLGRSAALDGMRVLLIDCDFRTPAVARGLKVPASNGLDHLLIHGASSGSPIRTDAASGLHYIPTEAAPHKSQELLGGRLFAGLLQEVRRHYDLIILDCPPLATVSDTVLITQLADATLVVTQWRKTKNHMLTRAVRRLAQGHSQAVALILNRIDPRLFDRYMNGRCLSLD